MSLLRLSRFTVIGGLNAVIGLSLLYLFLQVLDWNLYLSYILVYLIGITISYLLNSKYTFKQKATFKDSKTYYLYYLIGLAAGLCLLSLIDHFLDYSKFVTTLLVIPPRTLFTYFFLNKYMYK